MTTWSPLRVTVFDYGAGNLHSLVKSMDGIDVVVRIEPDSRELLKDTDALVLPGVGAFSRAADRLGAERESLRQALNDGLPALCICLGMQLLFDRSEEGAGRGIGLIRGDVARLTSARVPQIGWNTVEWNDEADDGLEIAYFANSYVCRPHPASGRSVIAWSEHEGDRFVAAVRHRETLGIQFHPEKSSRPGVTLIRNFLERARRVRDELQPAQR